MEEQRPTHVSTAAASPVSDDVRRCSGQSRAEMDLECGLAETKLHSAKIERDCRICHLSFDASNHESGIPIELGCSCKEDLAAAHRHCAEAWFKIKGDIVKHPNQRRKYPCPGSHGLQSTCEICGSIAHNVTGSCETDSSEQHNESNDATAAITAATVVVPPHSTEARNFWQGHRFLNFLLACMVFAFVISWLFHFKIPS